MGAGRGVAGGVLATTAEAEDDEEEGGGQDRTEQRQRRWGRCLVWEFALFIFFDGILLRAVILSWRLVLTSWGNGPCTGGYTTPASVMLTA